MKVVYDADYISKPFEHANNIFSAYVQEVGRAGREDMQAQAILFYNSSDLGVKHIRAEMKNYCQTKKCLREVINEFFGFSTEIKPLNCCSVCQSELSIEWDFGNLLL
jgi:superfamily II DNA helicase RecQ